MSVHEIPKKVLVQNLTGKLTMTVEKNRELITVGLGDVFAMISVKDLRLMRKMVAYDKENIKNLIKAMK